MRYALRLMRYRKPLKKINNLSLRTARLTTMTTLTAHSTAQHGIALHCTTSNTTLALPEYVFVLCHRNLFYLWNFSTLLWAPRETSRTHNIYSTTRHFNISICIMVTVTLVHLSPWAFNNFDFILIKCGNLITIKITISIPPYQSIFHFSTVLLFTAWNTFERGEILSGSLP